MEGELILQSIKFATKPLLWLSMLALVCWPFLVHTVHAEAGDDGSPVIIQSNPEPFDSDVTVDSSITFVFDRPIQPGSGLPSITVSSDETISVTASVYGNQLIITPDQPLEYATAYVVHVPANAVQNMAGNPMQEAYNLHFATQVGPLDVIAVHPVNGSSSVPVHEQIWIAFDREISVGPHFEEILLFEGDQPKTVTPSVYENLLKLAPLTDFAPSVTYSVYVPYHAVQDASANPNPPIQFTFTTEDSGELSLPDSFEPNDVPSGATPLAAGSAVLSYLSAGTDVDFYRLDATRNANLIATLTLPQGRNYQLQVYDEEANLIAAGDRNPIDPIVRVAFPVTAGTSYWFKVHGADALDYGDVPYALLAQYQLDTPQNLHVVSHTGATAVLAWSPLDEQWGSVTYSVYQDNVYLVSTPETTITLQNLTGGATATYTVKASNGIDLDSEASNAVSLLLFGDDVVPPTKPSIILSANGWTNQAVMVAVGDGMDDYSGVSKSQYRIGLEGTWMDYAVPFVIDTEGETLLFARTLDRAGNISEEAEAVVKIDRTAPSAPSRLIKTQFSESSVDIEWDAATDNVGVDRYYIYYDDLFLGDTDGTAANVIGLLPSSVYRLTVRAVDKAGNLSAPSNTVLITTFKQPVYAYDASGRLTSIQYEDGTKVIFLYDANGNLIRTYLEP
jgi:YD repeat-containing protein